MMSLRGSANWRRCGNPVHNLIIQRDCFAPSSLAMTSNAGFTLIELILVVAIVLILGTMGTSLGARFMTQNAVANAADQLVGDLRKAQTNAMGGKQNDNWSVNYTSNTITLYKGTTFAGHDPAFDEKFSVPGGVTMTPPTFTITFARMTGKTTGTSITISGNGTQRTIDIYSQGMVTR